MFLKTSPRINATSHVCMANYSLTKGFDMNKFIVIGICLFLQGENKSEYFLGLTPVGVVVYKNKKQVGKYFW